MPVSLSAALASAQLQAIAIRNVNAPLCLRPTPVARSSWIGRCRRHDGVCENALRSRHNRHSTWRETEQHDARAVSNAVPNVSGWRARAKLRRPRIEHCPCSPHRLTVLPATVTLVIARATATPAFRHRSEERHHCSDP